MATSSYSDTLTYVERDLADAAMMDSPLWDRLAKSVPKDLVQMNGKYSTKGTVKLRNGWNMRQSAEYTGSANYRPTSYAVTVDETSFDMYKSWGSVTFTREELETGDLIGENGVNIKNVNIKGLMDSFAWHQNMAIRNDNIGRITNQNDADTSGTTMVVDDAREFKIGMIIDSFTHAAATAKITSATLTGVNKSTNTLTWSGSETLIDNADIVVEDSRATWPYGLSAILADASVDYSVGGYIVCSALASYGGITKTTYTNFQSPYFQPAGAGNKQAFRKGDFDALIAIATEDMNTAPAWTACVCDAETAAAIVDAFPVNRVSMEDKLDIKIGTRGGAGRKVATIFSPLLKHGQIDILVMPHFWRYTAAFINENDLEIRWTEPPHFVKDENGSILRYQGHDAGTSSPDAFVSSYQVRQAIVANPQQHGILVGIEPGESFGALA